MKRLSKTMAHALRHAPGLYHIVLDEHGWTPISDLLDGLRAHHSDWADLQRSDLDTVINRPGKQRYEIQGDTIRALYGHSKGVLAIIKQPAEPPATLYHGTQSHVLPAIKEQGLQPMNRQYVHHAVDKNTAADVGKRRRGELTILTIHALQAHQAGIHFYRGNSEIWLSDPVPPAFIGFPSVG